MPPKKPITAAGQFLGYSLQQTRLCYYLLRSDDLESVSTEEIDDIAVHHTDGSITIEQCKSALSSNPASDLAPDFWKTLANWSRFYKNNEYPPISKLIYYVTPKKNGNIIEKIDSAKSIGAAHKTLIDIKKLSKALGSRTECGKVIKEFISADEQICIDIIQKFRFVTEDDPLVTIKRYLRPVIRTEHLDDFCPAALGIAKDCADRLIRAKQTAIISPLNYRKKLRAFITRNDLSGLLIATTPPPSDQIMATIANAPLFIRQLHTISTAESTLQVAVSDYLQAISDKIFWANEGLVVEESFDQFDADLIRNHTLHRDEVEEERDSIEETKRGRILYRKCTSSQIPLDGRALPSRFVSGEYNILADSAKIWWHPRGEQLFATPRPADEDLRQS